jgi:hypothetical protein
MAKKQQGIEQVIERIVAKVLDSHLPQLRADLVREVVAEAGSQLANSEPGGGQPDASERLLKAVSAIQAATTQRDVLRGMLDSAASYCGRIALFVVKGGSAIGWQARSFPNNDAIRDFQLDANAGLVSRVLEQRSAVSAKASDIGKKFLAEFGAPDTDHCLVLPLVLKEKVAALIYADGGAGSHFDKAALELLVVSTGTWLEVSAQRKASPKEPAAESAPGPEKAPVARAAAAHAAPSFSDPFAGHAPLHGQAGSAASGVEASQTGGAADAVTLSPDADTHKKAQRFARLLVDEIKLYNQAKVMEGRQNKDLYDRLKEDIDKSRASYLKRFGNTPAASGDYFNLEVIRSLAEDDVSLLGTNFKR